MQNNSLDEIVKCDIDLTQPVANDVSFDSILLVAPAPSGSGTETMTGTILISKADELLDYGYTVDDAAYVAATVAFSQDPSPSEIYVTVRQKKAKGDDPEEITATLARAADEASFYGIHLTSYRDAADIKAAITWTEANEKLYAFEYTDYSSCPVSNFSYNRSFGVYSGAADGYDAASPPPENLYAGLALMAKCFGYAPGSETWALKTLSTIVPSRLSSSQKKDLDEKNITTYRRYAKTNVTFGGKTLSGEWIDVIRFRDWLKAEIQTNAFSALHANRKVPFTDPGIGLVEGGIRKALADGQTVGGIAPTEFSRDEEIPGYTVTAPLASSFSEAQRKTRRLTNIKWTARIAGAIHFANIGGTLTY